MYSPSVLVCEVFTHSQEYSHSRGGMKTIHLTKKMSYHTAVIRHIVFRRQRGKIDEKYLGKGKI